MLAIDFYQNLRSSSREGSVGDIMAAGHIQPLQHVEFDGRKYEDKLNFDENRNGEALWGRPTSRKGTDYII